MVAILINCSRGLRPRTPGYFSLAGKVPKRAFKGGGCSDSPSPLKNPSTHNGFSRGLRPLAKEATPPCTPRVPSVRQDNWRLCGGFQRGAGAPLCVVADEGATGEKPHRKGFSSRAVFWLLFVRTKSNPGLGRGGPEPSGSGDAAPERFRKETYFPPARRWANLSASVPCVGTDYQ